MEKELEKKKIEDLITEYVNEYKLSDFDVVLMKYYDKKKAIVRES